MKTPSGMRNVLASLVAGYVATKASDYVGDAIEAATPRRVRERERRVRPGPAAQVAAEKMANWTTGHSLNGEEKRTGAQFIHIGLGLAWGYGHKLLRDHTRLHPAAVSLASGLSLAALIDEGVSPALGFAAPPDRYPALTHARSIANHVVWGMVCGAVYEVLGKPPRRRKAAPAPADA